MPIVRSRGPYCGRVLIRRAATDEVGTALAVIGEAFGLDVQPPTAHTLAAGAADGGMLVAVEDGQVLGTASWLGFGPDSGWLGGIAVSPRARGRGLGGALTQAAIDGLGPRRTVLLLASALGKPIYDRLGFVSEGDYRVFRSEGTGAAARADETRAAEGEASHAGEEARGSAGDSRGAAGGATVDQRATGEDRSVALAASTIVAHGDAVAIRPPWRALPIVGAPGDAEHLLRELVQPGLRLAVPEQNTRAVRTLQALGSEVEPVTRMRLGPQVQWRPEEIWGVFSLFFG